MHTAVAASRAQPTDVLPIRLQVWQCDPDVSNRIVHDFFKSKHFCDGIPVIPGAPLVADAPAVLPRRAGARPLPYRSPSSSCTQQASAGAVEALRRLKTKHDLEVVTSRQFAIEESTHAWLAAHFPDTFADVHFGNHFAKEGAARKKSEICSAIGAHVLIDDNPTYARDCAAHGIHVLLFNWNLSYPWCEDATECAPHPAFVCCKWPALLCTPLLFCFLSSCH